MATSNIKLFSSYFHKMAAGGGGGFSSKSIGFFNCRSIHNGCFKYEFDVRIGVAVT